MDTAATPKKSGGATLIALIVLIALIAAAVGGHFVLRDRNTLTTDNVKVAADLYAITPAAAGELRRLMVAKGDAVTKDQIIAQAENTGYLKSPVNGEIVECDVAQGQMVSPSTVIAMVADTRDIYIQANIERRDPARARRQAVRSAWTPTPAARCRRGAEIDKITQNAISGSAMSYSTSGTYTKVTQTIPVKIDLRDRISLGDLIGTNATVTIQLG
jgi:multidrug resistance efflux pump